MPSTTISDWWSDFWYVHRSSMDRVFGVPVFGSGHSDKWWFKATIGWVYDLAVRVRDAKYWLYYRFHPEHKYNLIHTKLKPGYYDVDTLMLHGMFALLERYVVDEMGGVENILEGAAELMNEPDPYMPGLSEAQATTDIAIVNLYRWWTITKPAEEKRRDELCHSLYGSGRVTWGEEQNGFVQMSFKPFDEAERVLDAEFRTLEAKIKDDEQTMLKALIDVRKSLWT